MSYDVPLSRRSHSSSTLSQYHLQPQHLPHALSQGPSPVAPIAPSSFSSLPPRHPQPPSSAFTTLSTVAMDELHALEQQEAMRRAEYEARHAEALRRAELQTRQSWARLSKSATTSPVLSPVGNPIGDNFYFGLSNERGHVNRGEAEGPDASELRERAMKKEQRRLSGPAWYMASSTTSPNDGGFVTGPLGHSSSSGHLVDAPRAPGNGHHTAAWSHPYQNATPNRHRGSNGSIGARMHEDSPSPMSSDSESLNMQHRPQHHQRHTHPLVGSQLHHPSHIDHPHQHNTHASQSPPHFPSGLRANEFNFTPSASPFLGPLRTLNIHSTTPSRAPSPVLLPPPHFAPSTVNENEDTALGSPTSSLFHRPSPGEGSPPHSASWAKLPHQPRRGESGSGPALPHHSLSDRSLPPLPSSGPSSSGSSPGSFALHRGGNLGESSASSSRAPSPQHWSRPPLGGAAQHHTLSHHTPEHGLPTSATNSTNGPHHHLAHSVRLAFGMTPITGASSSAPRSPPRSHAFPHTYAITQPHSGVSTPMHFASMSMSMPGSRSGSPPITLPPLKTLKLEGDKDGKVEDAALDGDGKTVEKVALPGFSQFEAAVRGEI